MNQPLNQPEPEPPYTNLELMFAHFIVHLMQPALDHNEERLSKLIMEYLTCDGPDRIEPRMAAIGKCNADSESPIHVELMKLPEGMYEQVKEKVKAMAKTAKNPKNPTRLKRG